MDEIFGLFSQNDNFSTKFSCQFLALKTLTSKKSYDPFLRKTDNCPTDLLTEVFSQDPFCLKVGVQKEQFQNETSQDKDSNFPGGSFSIKSNVRVPIQFKRETFPRS